MVLAVESGEEPDEFRTVNGRKRGQPILSTGPAPSGMAYENTQRPRRRTPRPDPLRAAEKLGHFSVVGDGGNWGTSPACPAMPKRTPNKTATSATARARKRLIARPDATSTRCTAYLPGQASSAVTLALFVT
jgi:hypothetical protein